MKAMLKALFRRIFGPLFFSFLASSAGAQAREADLFSYITEHSYLAGGPLLVDGEKATIFEVRFVDDFALGASTRGVARVSLFTLQRQGEPAPPAPGIPTSLEAAAAYSDGEVWLGVYRQFRPWLALECVGGLTFKMTSLSGTVGDPLDGTKMGLGCGPRLSYRGNNLSVLGGHYGPVAEKGQLLGFVPQVFVHAYLPLSFLGKNTAFTPDLAFGRSDVVSPDPTVSTVKATMRLLVSTRF